MGKLAFVGLEQGVGDADGLAGAQDTEFLQRDLAGREGEESRGRDPGKGGGGPGVAGGGARGDTLEAVRGIQDCPHPCLSPHQ